MTRQEGKEAKEAQSDGGRCDPDKYEDKGPTPVDAR